MSLLHETLDFYRQPTEKRKNGSRMVLMTASRKRPKRNYPYVDTSPT